jgi:signal transduction histidine kinase
MNRAEPGHANAMSRRSRAPDATLEGEVKFHTPSSRSQKSDPRRRRGIEIAIVVLLFIITLGAITGALDTGSYTDTLDPLNVTLAALTTLPLLAVRRAPLAVFALTAVATAALLTLGSQGGVPTPIIALYFVALSPPTTRLGRWGTVLTIVGSFFLISYIDRLDNSHGLEPIGALLFLAAWYLGDWVRQRRERTAESAERAMRAEREAERERRLAAAEERTRIARDLHDSAGHAISVILVQAGAARLLAQRDPDRAREALETIEEVARETIGEIDQLVRGLRDDDLPQEQVEASEPRPGLAALDRLIDRNRAAGLDVAVNVRREHRMPPTGVDQATYRILQEALTNAARHGAGNAEVELIFGPHALELSVTNPTRPNWAPTGAGHGLVGMRERATLLGGRLTAAGGDGIFRVKAELPYSAERP